MQLDITVRHFTLEDDLREKLEKRLAKLERYSPRAPVSVRLTVTHEGGRFHAEAAWHLRNSDFHAKAERTEPDLAADEAIESLERQLRRYKDRVANRAKGEESGLGEALASAGLLETSGAELVQEGFRLKDLSVDAAVEVFRESAHPFFVFRNSETSQVAVIYRRDDGGYGLLQPIVD
jgi:putative sigma-54 modulation protein